MLKIVYVFLLFFVSYAAPCSAITEQERKAFFNALSHTIQTTYVQVELVPEILRALAQCEKSRNTKNTEQLIADVNRVLQKFDKHFAASVTPLSPTPTVQPVDWYTKLAADNFGFTRTDIVANNIGFLSFWGFADLTNQAKHFIKQQFEVLKTVDGLIIDLRGNGGGSAQAVQYISSFLLSGRVHLNSLYSRATRTTLEFHTDPQINYANLSQVPIIILVSNDTFSAAEEFAYNLQQLKRATVIGEPTRGGANPWQYFDLISLTNNEPHPVKIRIAIPTAKAINPITNTNWEKRGVLPQVLVEPNSAEMKALAMLKNQLKSAQ